MMLVYGFIQMKSREKHMATKKKRRKVMLVVSIVLGLLVSAYVVLVRIPVEKAIYPDDLGKYDNIIVVKNGTGAPTDCMIIGDSNGLYGSPVEDWIPVHLLGTAPPNRESGTQYGSDFKRSQTKYVCFVEYNGKQPYGQMGPIDTYTVSDWAPLGPIYRLTPAWIEPQGYTNLLDVLLNTVGRRI
jgi:hypothetical protein